MTCCKKEASWIVWYLSGLGKFMSFKYKTCRAHYFGLKIFPAPEFPFEQIWYNFCITWRAFVWELQYMIAKLIFNVRFISENDYLISKLFPHPSGPTTIKF